MIPIGDSVRSRTFPWINYLLILANLAVFVHELSLGRGVDLFMQTWGTRPGEITALVLHGTGDADALLTLVTSMFIHAGWLHVLGNMLFLWIFGDNVNDALGHINYLLFYLLGGIGAAAVQIVVSPSSMVPLVGASGAISAVLGAYLLMYPRAGVSVIVPVFFLFPVIEIPAFLVIGLWFAEQFASGLAAISTVSAITGGVAFWAHIGGFVSGVVLLPFFPRRRLRDRKPIG